MSKGTAMATTWSAASARSRARFACPSRSRARRWTRHYEKGVLTIRVPKPADMQRQARRIEVSTV